MVKIGFGMFALPLACFSFLIWSKVNAIPLHHEELKSYQNDEEFNKELKNELDEHHKRNGALFDKILLVNRIHKKWLNKYQENKRGSNEDIDQMIIANNLGHRLMLFEGDIEPNEYLKSVLAQGRKRNAAYDRRWLWRSRYIPYTIQNTLLDEAKTNIGKAINIVKETTCIRWVPYDAAVHKHRVHFEYGAGCYSKIGKSNTNTGVQKISIGKGCEKVGVVLHEMTHAMGFFHEQSRDDRDKYIQIMWENILPGYQDQFEKYSHGTIDKMNINYNYDSIMHYSAKTFGKGGETTIKPIDATKTIGNTKGTLSNTDILEINALYSCSVSAEEKAFSSWSNWARCDESCNKERQRFCFDENNCPGVHDNGVQTEKMQCTDAECPVPIDGHWARWGSWGICSTTCDDGKRQRTRKCEDPPSSNGGKSCTGEATGFGICTNRRCQIGQYDVDFEDGWGVWYIPSDSKLQWTLKKGSSKSWFTGPIGDHTLQQRGHYIYVNSVPTTVQYEDTAVLVSQPIELSKPHCLSFAYHMYGSSMGTLKLSAFIQNTYWVKMFSINGDQGGKWHIASVNLDIPGKFQLSFKATIGGHTSDIALDDIYIDEGVCAGEVEGGSVVCEDNDPIQCGNLARKGECTTNTVMANFCKESCGKCPDKTCKDLKDGCKFWASIRRECFNNPKFMFKECRESCGICSGCADQYENCMTLASKGDCQTNREYMHSNCKASCGLCGDCTDVDNPSHCETWAGDGLCLTNAGYTLIKCKATCTGCSGVLTTSPPVVQTTSPPVVQTTSPPVVQTTSPPVVQTTSPPVVQTTSPPVVQTTSPPVVQTTSPPVVQTTSPPVVQTTSPASTVCEDTDGIVNCGDGARKGECTTIKIMADQCKETCGKCPDKPCMDKKDDCKKWADFGECFKNPVFMYTNCKESCGICSGCADQSKDCTTRASQGECQTNREDMHSNCKASCGLCGDCVDVYGDSNACQGWANNDQCRINSGYMMIQCKATCTGCSGVLTTSPPVVQTTSPPVVQTTSPPVVQTTSPPVVQTTSPSVVQTTSPLVVQTTSPPVVQTSPPVVQTTLPAPTVCEDTDDIVNCGDGARKGECTTKQIMADQCKETCGKCPDKPCMDKKDDCKNWADFGECFKNPVFMYTNCKESCGICSGCADQVKNCMTWASQGECQKNRVYMHSNCKASCGLCGDCTDVYGDSNQCAIWASNGDCENKDIYMKRNCKATCTACSDCADQDRNCSTWASQGHCQTSQEYMHSNCKASCGLCGDCVDAYGDSNACRGWANNNECSKNPGYMMIQCKATCTGCSV